MSREQKLALLIGFALVLVVGVVVSDHFSTAMHAELEPAAEEEAPAIRTALPDIEPRRGQPIEPNLETQLSRRTPAPAAEPEPAESGGQALSDTLAGVRRTVGHLGEGLRSAPAAAQRDAVPVIEMGRVEQPNPYAGPIARHTVARGESLWSIAERRYGDGRLHERLAAFNKDVIGPDGVVRAGTTLRIPPGDVLLGKRALAREERAEVTQSDEAGTSRESEAGRAYIVQKGDTLGEIAQRELGSARRWREIARLNELEDPDRVPVGTALKLPR